MIIYDRSGVRGATLNAVLIAFLSVIKFLKAVKKLIFQIHYDLHSKKLYCVKEILNRALSYLTDHTTFELKTNLFDLFKEAARCTT